MAKPLIVLCATVCLIWSSLALLRTQRAEGKLRCVNYPGAIIVTTASGAQVCVSGEAMVWL